MEYSNELYHHGIKGMKWGIRRYQNKDGSLTPAGQKRRAKLESKLEKLTGSKKDTDVAMTNRKKSLNEMTDDEVRAYTNRMQLEKNYRDAERNLAAVTPQKISKGQKFMNTVMNDMIKPALANSGRKALESMMDQAVKKATKGQADGDSIEALTKVRDKLKLKAEIDKYKHPEKYMSEEDKGKAQRLAWEAEDREARKRGYKDAADEIKSKADEEARRKNEARSQQEYDERNRQKDAEQNAYRSAKGRKDTTNDIDWSEYKRPKPGVVDVEPSELIPVDDVPESTRRAGENYVTYLLEERNK